eukprot:933850-Heterocapsa_arctica.AAC.1
MLELIKQSAPKICAIHATCCWAAVPATHLCVALRNPNALVSLHKVSESSQLVQAQRRRGEPGKQTQHIQPSSAKLQPQLKTSQHP